MCYLNVAQINTIDRCLKCEKDAFYSNAHFPMTQNNLWHPKMLKSRGQTGLKAKILALASVS